MMQSIHQHERDTAGPTRRTKTKQVRQSRLAGLVDRLGNRGLQALRARTLQRKAEDTGVSVPQDPLEMLADRVADQVLSEPDAAVGPAPPPAGEPASETAVQRDALPEAGATHSNSMPDTPGPPAAVRSPRAGGGPSPHGALASELLSGLDAGSPMPRDVRRFMEDRFGRSFADVRVHTDDQAAEAARSVAAKAFTIGSEIVFGEGRWTPETHEGKRLLAHELTHVVQQGADTGAPAPESATEVDAERVGHDVAEGRMAEVSTRSIPGNVQLQDEPKTGGKRTIDVQPKFSTTDEPHHTVYEGNQGVAIVYDTTPNTPVQATAWTNDRQIEDENGEKKTFLSVDITAPPGHDMNALHHHKWLVSVNPIGPFSPPPVPQSRKKPKPETKPQPKRPVPDRPQQPDEPEEVPEGAEKQSETKAGDVRKALESDPKKALELAEKLSDKQLENLDIELRLKLLKATAELAMGEGNADLVIRLLDTAWDIDATTLLREFDADFGSLLTKLKFSIPFGTSFALDAAVTRLEQKTPLGLLPPVDPKFDWHAHFEQIAKNAPKYLGNELSLEKDEYGNDIIVHRPESEHRKQLREARERARSLPFEKRIPRMKELAENTWTGLYNETEIIEMIEHVEQKNAASLLHLLETETSDGTPLIDRLDQVIDLENNFRFHVAMTALRTRTMSKEQLAEARSKGLKLPWHDTMYNAPATFFAKKTAEGKIRVNMPALQVAELMQSERYGAEARTLPSDVYLGPGRDLDPNALVTIHDYDTGREIELFARDLVGYQNRGVRTSVGRSAQVAALPAGGAAGLTWKAAGFIGADLFVLGTGEYRVEHPNLAMAGDVVGTGLAFYGGYHLLAGGGRFLIGRYRNWRIGRVPSSGALGESNVPRLLDDQARALRLTDAEELASRTPSRRGTGFESWTFEPETMGLSKGSGRPMVIRLDAPSPAGAARPSRLAPPLEAPQARATTWRTIGGLDELNRPTFVDSVLDSNSLAGGPRPSNPRNLPGGFEAGIGYERTHLGAHEFGFPTTPENLAGASGQTNRFLGSRATRPPTMRRVELDVRAAIRSGQTVRYRVTAIYDGSAPYPVAFHMQAMGSGPDGIRIDTIVRNWTHHPY